MKTKLFFYGLLLSFSISFSQTTAIPDAVFEQALIDLAIDTNGLNGNILNSDASGVTFLSVSGLGISDLTGIEAFTSLLYLYCDNNSLTTLNLSSNPSLQILYCGTNSLTSLDVTNNSALTNLSCGSNFTLSSIDVSQNLALTDLSIALNPSITSLNVTNNTALKFLNTWLAPIGNLDLSQNAALETLNCMSSNLSSLDVSSNTALTSIDIRGNQLTVLDLSNNGNLFGMLCSNNLLESLNVKNGNNSNVTNSNFSAVNNPSLTCINVDNEAYSNANWFNIDGGASFSENCVLSINDEELNTYLFYPNPVNDHMIVEINNYSMYSIYNTNGQLIKNGYLVVGKNIIKLVDLSQGIYILNITNESSDFSKKLVKL